MFCIFLDIVYGITQGGWVSYILTYLVGAELVFWRAFWGLW